MARAASSAPTSPAITPSLPDWTASMQEASVVVPTRPSGSGAVVGGRGGSVSWSVPEIHWSATEPRAAHTTAPASSSTEPIPDVLDTTSCAGSYA
jgi:hypothetical protein